jgi:tetratricopeptide (TPR) repeat protein
VSSAGRPQPSVADEALLADVRKLWMKGRFGDGLQLLQALPPDLREQYPAMAYEAELSGRLGDHEREVELYSRLIEQRPDMASFHVSQGYALMMLGQRAEAIAAYRRAIAIQPTYGKAWWSLSELRSYQFEDADIDSMSSALSGVLRSEDALHLRFALGKGQENRGDAAAAIEHYKIANALRSSSFHPQAGRVTGKVDQAIAAYSPEIYANRSGQSCQSDAPIFIVGLQRSGSTLIEQILASHPDVQGLGELPLIRQLEREVGNPNTIVGFQPAELASLGEAYLNRAQSFKRTDRPRFIDKMPNNWLHVGFIRLIFPKAKIIDARRHPMATGWSNFRQNYGSGLAWTYDLAAIGTFYRDYLRLITHFERVQPGAIHRVVNERLIEDVEGEVRRLLDFLELPFDPACLEFHQTKRAVQTPSAEQVRKPINREGVDRWREYEPWLGELKAALGPALEGWDAPPGTYQDDGGEERE